MTALLPAIDGLEGEGFIDRLAQQLRGLEGVSGVHVAKHPDPSQRYTATARFRGTARQASRRIGQALRELAAPDSELHSAIADERSLALEFVIWREGAWSATGRVTVTLVDGV